MNVGSRLLLFLLFYLTNHDSLSAFSLQHNEFGNVRSLRELMERGSEPLKPHLFRSSYNKEGSSFSAYRVHERDSTSPQLDTALIHDTDDAEIDTIGGIVHQTSADRVPPRDESQPESVPEVVQKLPENSQKQLRVPQDKEQPPRFTKEAIYRPADKTTSDIYFIALVAGCSGAAVFGVVAAGFCWYKLQKNAKAAAAADYPAYGVTGPSKEHDVTSPPNGDRKLAQNAQMFHYQHQKQQMIAIEKANGDRHVSTSDLDSEEENEGDYTVYECAGLAPTGEMEVKNPLFEDDPTPAPSAPVTSAKEVDK